MFVLCLQGSPRKDGNTATLISIFAEEIKSLGVEIEVINVCEKRIQPCIECGICEEKGFCPIDDDMQDIYHLLVRSDLVVIAAPMFFYSFPAQLKALIDRSQTLWSRRYVFKLSDPGRLWRKGFMLSLGATKGRNLFEGANLVAKYFFDAIGAEYLGYLGYRKIEKKGDIEKHPKAIDEVREKARSLVADFLKRKKVLFVSKEDSDKTQMAYAFARLYFGNKIDVRSAGIKPAKKIDPIFVEVMAEKGIDIFYLKPMHIKDITRHWKPDIVICLDNISLSMPSDKWNFDHISDERTLRDEIEKKVKEYFRGY